MKKRLKKKLVKKYPFSKKELKLFRQYTNRHKEIDYWQGLEGASHITYDDDTLTLSLKPMMSDKDYISYQKLCQKLFELTNRITSDDYTGEIWAESVLQWNYRFIKHKKGVPQKSLQFPHITYYVNQKTILEDYYEGTTYIPVSKKWYIAYNYEC